jgi:hypothetical protein
MTTTEPSTKQGVLPRGGRLLAAAGVASTAALLLFCVLNGPANDAAGRNLRNSERQLGVRCVCVSRCVARTDRARHPAERLESATALT